ncbi:family 88 glycosyl hydrolase [Mycena rebaudengoi]|nr:family 88 glycosyl hydrolase [Mycena rebaudengoi]
MIRTIYLTCLFLAARPLAALADDAIPFSPGFDMEKVASLAESLPEQSWEFGTAAEALLELYNPELSVFGKPFPVAKTSPDSIKALSYAREKITIGNTGLSDGNGATGDPASLGVSAVMLGKSDKKYSDAATVQLAYLLDSGKVPRYENGAISHRVEAPELWADFMYMAPPFLAFYAADSDNATLLEETYKQCGLYRDVLQSKDKGMWQHIIGPQGGATDRGHWSTGNGWAAAGMARVLATIMHAPVAKPAAWRDSAVNDLSAWIKEILDTAREAPADGGLLRNYLDDTSPAHGFGEIAGSSLLASVAYRMAVLQPAAFGAEYVKWADGVRGVLADGHVVNGVATPAVNPHDWHDTKPDTNGSPEGQGMVVLMYAAWRDCVNAGTCQQNTKRRAPSAWMRLRGRLSL